MLPDVEDNEKYGLLDFPLNSRTPKTIKHWPIVAGFLAILLTLLLLSGTRNKFEVELESSGTSHSTHFNQIDPSSTVQEANSSFTERVRANVKKMLENREEIQYQQLDGPLRPFVNEYSKYPIARQYNLSACFVNKILSTTLNSIFCYLRDSEGFESRNLDMKTVYWTNEFCGEQHGIIGSTAALIDQLPNKHVTFQILRDPIKRFVSAFINKCVDELTRMRAFNNTREVCYGCDDDIECTVRRAYKEMVKISRRTRMYNISAMSRDYYTEHFMPLTWYCDISTRSEEVEYIRYISHGEKKKEMTKDIIEVMRKAGVEQYKLDNIEEVLTDDEPLTHATKGTSRPAHYLEMIYNSTEMLETLKKMYHYDYIVFEYPVPQLGQIEPET